MADPLTEVDERAAAVAKAPRITKEFIEENIRETSFATGDELVQVGIKENYAHLTVCTLRVANGFIVIGKSAPMDPRNFNAQLGQQLAYEDAFRQLWPLYAFATLEDEWLFESETRDTLRAIHDDGEPTPSE
jgi:hypothetical protein